jgi:methylmalonyl-CoA mutase cobalamin-binding domain/chain
MPNLNELKDAVVEMQEEAALAMTREMLDSGQNPLEIFETYQDALAEIGRRFAEQIYFIPELIMSGELMKAASDMIKPKLAEAGMSAANEKKLGKVLIATVQGDIHDIGKNIVSMMFDLNGFEVRDLGVDVPPEKIIAEAKSFGADIVGLSGLLTLAFEPMKTVIAELRADEATKSVKVIIGGGQMDEQICNHVGADGWTTDAVSGINTCREWLAA